MTGITRAELDGAVRAGIVSADQADKLAAYFGAAVAIAEQPRFTFVHVLYYLGGMIAIGAMTLFMTLGWNALGGWGGCLTAILYGVLALLLSHWFLEQKKLYIPAGIMATLAVVMVPLAIFGAQMALGYWGENKPYRDFHVFIASRDYAFWLYLFGVLTFWGGLTSMNSDSELGKLAYFGINVLMILIGAVLGRRVFAVFGGLGVAFYLGHLSQKVFKDSLLFPFALSLIGLAIIGLGVLWQRREAQLSAGLRGFLPAALRELIEARAVR